MSEKKPSKRKKPEPEQEDPHDRVIIEGTDTVGIGNRSRE
jgi:hypothetical protein